METNDCIDHFDFAPIAEYATMNVGGKQRRVSRLVCEAVYGPPPSSRHHAAHSCGNPPCVNKRHLRWATPVQNAKDRTTHGRTVRGERFFRARLTTATAIEALELSRSGVSVAELAERFGVTTNTIQLLVSRHSWRWLDNRS